MITVKVCHESSGKPAQGKRVVVGRDDFFSQGVTDSQLTDSNGEAHFDIEPCNGKVFVDGKTVHKGHISGRVIVYI